MSWDVTVCRRSFKKEWPTPRIVHPLIATTPMPRKVLKTVPLDEPIDAGAHDDHLYDKALHPGRAFLRRALLPIIRGETDMLAAFQAAIRTPLLDSYFIWTANLGTHTFFMVGLPLLFWFGEAELGRALVTILSMGVFWSAFIKDFMCLPRPLSPPVHRLTMSTSTALEYGFPSTHSANSVSVALYILAWVLEAVPPQSPERTIAITGLSLYVFSVVFGRIYCGMHSVTDIIGGVLVAYVIYFVQWTFRAEFEALVTGDGYWVFLVVPICLAMVGVHPDPVDRCPCFEDSVCFMGVLIGLIPGSWVYAHSSYAWDKPARGTVPYDVRTIGLVVSIVRVVFGVACLFAWRLIAKKVAYNLLPPLYRAFNLPHRKFEIAARTYRSLHDEPIHPIPSVLDLRALAQSAADSDHVGLQSSIDVHERMARDAAAVLRARNWSAANDDGEESRDREKILSVASQPKEATEKELEGREMAPMEPNDNCKHVHAVAESKANGEAMRSLLVLEDAPLRYDVDIVTKLIVYAGIGWVAVHTVPILFELLGMGMGVGVRYIN